MKTVNPWFLCTLLEPLTGLADDDEAVEQYSSFDGNDRIQVRGVIKDLFVPYFAELSSEIQERAKLALAYCLGTPIVNFGRVYDSCLLPFPHPADPREFFLWLWEELFPGESIELPQRDEYREAEDINEPILLAIRAKKKRDQENRDRP